MAEIQKVTMSWPDYPPITEKNAKALLQTEQNPIWHIEPDGELISANPMALWLWGLLSLTDTLFSISDLLNINVFDLYRRNLARIPVELPENRDFLTKQSAMVKRLLPESKAYYSPYTLFKEAMLNQPAHAAIFAHATNPNKEWEYTLKITHPDLNNPTQLLEFRTTVNAIQQDGMHMGYIMRYLPGAATIHSIKQLYQRVSGRYGIIPYLLTPGPQKLEVETEGRGFNTTFADQISLIDTVDAEPFITLKRFVPDDTNDPWNALLELIEMTHEQNRESDHEMTGAIEEQKTKPLSNSTTEIDPFAEWSLLLELTENIGITPAVTDNEKTTDSIDHNFIWDEWES